jgi:pimeloyl-ACP methyl ester carboxylesterase
MAKGKAAWSAALQSRVTDLGDVRLHDRGAGHGRPLVLVSGPARSGAAFIPAINALSPWFACRALDVPGFDRAGDLQPVRAVAELGDLLAEWLRVTEQPDAVIVGASSGCHVAVDCAARHDDITGPLVLIGPTGDPAGRRLPRRVVRGLRTTWRADATILPLLLADLRRREWRRVAPARRVVRADRIEAKLEAVRQATLVLRGEHDPITPARWAKQLATLLPDGRLATVVGGAHAVHFTAPQSVGLIIRQFLAEIGQAP